MIEAPPSSTSPARPGVNADAWALLALGAAVLWVYLPLGVLGGGSLYGSDFVSLHVRRLDFVRQELFGPSPHLPAWYPREFLGTPFWSNLQNFPLIPTRLPLLLVDPWTAYAVGVNVAAVLAAAFTYLLGRRWGVGRVGSAVAGWTFACAGFFASRVMAGHLPLLEAYPALPLLLWLVERHATSVSPRALRLNLLALAGAAAAVIVAGHPQLPAYALAAALVYLPVQCRGRGGLRRATAGAAALAAGVLCMSLVLYPMALLVARSTRALPLAPAANDFPFPVWRLKAFVVPWADGWPSIVQRGVPHVRFAGDHQLMFWDTICYTGWLPLAAALGLLLYAGIRRRGWDSRWVFLAVAGALTLLLALPRPWGADADGSWTVLRSPARQLYVTTFALAMAAGVAIDLLLRLRTRTRGSRGGAAAVAVLVAALVAAHAWDLRSHAHAFVMVVDPPPDEPASAALTQTLGDGRAAIDTNLVRPINRRVDDVGVFDSILLARPYRALLALSGQPAETNTQLISGPDLGPRALQWSGVTVVMTERRDLDLPAIVKGDWLNVYTVPGALPRAGFVPALGVRHLEKDAVIAQMRAGAKPNPSHIWLPPERGASPPAVPSASAPPVGSTAIYRRPRTDRIDVDVRAAEEGYVRVVEAFDPGWSATVDGRASEVLPADGYLMAVPVGAGSHLVRLTYSTPGVTTGFVLSSIGLVMVGAVVWLAPRLAGVSPSPPS